MVTSIISILIIGSLIILKMFTLQVFLAEEYEKIENIAHMIKKISFVRIVENLDPCVLP